MSDPGSVPPGGASREPDVAAAWAPDTATRTFSPGAGLGADLPFLFTAGQRFGPYLMVRPIGKGGMGQVYEAEEIESGRRVAVKILSRGIGDDEERERFLTEGRIAASLSHPTLVYVFGTSEVQGLPVIAMELAPAGTLKDLVVDGAPMAPAKAVDAILQVIAGLDVAASAGILHRDIKPSNCFVAADGRVLVGDFGLSVATLGRIAQHPGADGMIAGTPGFASPEQLRGERLDVRSDIYSVGATLYYLLTGRAPVDTDSISTFVTRTATNVPVSAAVLRAEVPKKLAAIIAECLSPVPAKRFASYAGLAKALDPYRSTIRTAAGLGRRFVAGAIDTYVSALPVTPLNITIGGAAIMSNDPSFTLVSLPTFFTIVVYCGVLEGFFGAGAGKALLGLRVMQRDGTRPGFLRAVYRAALFLLPTHLLTQAVNYWVLHRGGAVGAAVSDSMVGVAMAIITCGTLAALFSTARRRNGYAGLHDLASGTRVVMHRRRVEARASQNTSSADRAHAAGRSRIGPYVVDESLAATTQVPVATPTLIEGYDDRLRRPVWIQLLPTGTPPLPPLRRDLARPARPRWLAGRRTDAECWDAFEVANGRPLADIAVTPQPWSRVRHWMADLTHEVRAGVADGSLPDLELDRLWIGADDRARLLDWPAGTATVAQHSGATSPPDLSACCRFLYDVAIRAIGAVPARGAGKDIGLPLPVPGRDLLVKLRDCRYESADALTADVDRALRTPAAVSRTTRAVQLAACAALPILAPVIAFSAMTAIARLDTVDPKLMDLLFCLERVSDKDTSPEQRAALEIYVATHLRATVEDPSTWTRSFPALGRSPGLHEGARRILDEHADVPPQALAKAEPIAVAYLDGERKRLDDIRAPQLLGTAVRLSAIVALCVTAILALVMAVLLRGGFTFRTFGTAVTTASGSDVSRIRALGRAAIAWSPALLIVALPRVWHGLATNTRGGIALAIGTVLVMVAGGVFAILRPERGIPDWVAGTWLVPK